MKKTNKKITKKASVKKANNKPALNNKKTSGVLLKKNVKNPTSSIEVLSHFACGKCSKWWSIGDAVLEDRTDWFCPWCGTLNRFDK